MIINLMLDLPKMIDTSHLLKRWFFCLQIITWGVKYENDDGLSKADIHRTFSKALGKWEGAANLKFKEVASGEPDIWFKFVKGGHGDPYPFQMPYSNVLAHAFYPLDSKIGTYGFFEPFCWVLI